MTQFLLVLTLAVTLVVVIVLVAYLTAIIIALWKTKNDLAKLADGLIAIRDNTQPLPSHIKTINSGLSVLLHDLLKVNQNLGTIVAVKLLPLIKNKQK